MSVSKKSALLALITSSLLSSCAVHVAEKPNFSPAKATHTTSILTIYNTKEKAYNARGIKQQHLNNLTHPGVIQPSRFSKSDIKGIIERGDISDVEIILGLPADANFFALDQQSELWKNGSYLTLENKKKLLLPTSEIKEQEPSLDTTDVKMKTESYQNKAKKIIIKS